MQSNNLPPIIVTSNRPTGHMHSAVSLPPANISQGRYLYTADLLRLATTSSCPPYQSWSTYQSPIKLEAIALFLASHPDQAFAAYIHMGLLTGFRIGYSQDRLQLCHRSANHPSALMNKTVVDEQIVAELAAGRLFGPISPQLLPLVHTSPFNLVPKAHHSNKWCMICDLLSPIGHSVNDSIPPELCSLQYAKVDDAVDIIRKLGRGTQLVKLDIKDAYRIVPVHLGDYHLLGIEWRGFTYIDRALPFELHSAPKIFNVVADLHGCWLARESTVSCTIWTIFCSLQHLTRNKGTSSWQ